MKYILFLIPLLLLACNLNAQNDSLIFRWQTDTVLYTVESVVYHSTENVLFASCINGKPTEKDSNGYIAKISLTGEIIKLKWATGLNAPKGMGIYDNKLYVTDITDLVEINLENSRQTKRIPIQEAQFLNDIAISDSGDLFISDMYSNKIYCYSKGVVTIFIHSKELNFPNGLLCEENNLFIGTGNSILKANISTRDFETIITNTGSIDGLKRKSSNTFIVSDWKSRVKTVSNSHNYTILNTLEEHYNAADFEYISTLNLLIVPTFFANKILCYELRK